MQKTPSISLSLLVGLIIYLYGVSFPAFASHHKNIWPMWEVNNPLSQEVISHQEWQDFLNKHVVTNEEGINLIDYGHFNDEDRMLVRRYINRLALIDISNYNRDEQLAFWINLYNALIVRTVSDYSPVTSIQEINISPGLFSIGPWGAHIIAIGKTTLSLEDIMHRILRPIWNDPRVLYALSNGAIGSANLSKTVFEGSQIKSQLNDAASIYINSLRGVQVIEGKLVVSKIYEWYKEDFGRNEEDLIRHFLLFAKEPLRSQLQHINSIDNYSYNWHLNTTVT